jgi:polyhydroxybutyrate depolymerase
MLSWPVLAGAGAAATQPARQAALVPGQHLQRLEADGRDRSYLVHIPPGYDAATPTPVVLAFHGAWMNAALMASFSGLNATADREGFIVVYPNGTGFGEGMLFFNAWNSPGRAGRGPPDDVGFTAALLDDLAGVVNVDPDRIFATGMSNGAMMSYRLAAELSDRIAAIAPVGGTLAISRVRPGRPVPVIHFHGSADTIVPVDGPNRRTGRFVPYQSLERTMKVWIEINQCPPQPQVTHLPDLADDGTTVTRKVYGPGRNGSEVVLFLIEGAGHTWPGRKPPVNFLGRSTMDISANDLMWKFFQRHPMKK